MTISDKIFELIEERGMTQKEFSKRTGIPQSTISDWKGKRLNPSSDKILIICDVLQIPTFELLGGVGTDKYELPEHLLVKKNSEEYILIEKYRSLEAAHKQRLLGYMEALRELQAQKKKK